MDNEKEIIGRTGAVTGVDTPDPKEGDPSTIFTSTPAADRVGAAASGAGIESNGTGVVAPEVDPGAVTTQFDALATRNVEAMEHQLQRPEYEGSQAVETLGVGTATLEGVAAGAGLGVLPAGAIGQDVLNRADQNPGYTPPSKMSPPHEAERPGNLPAGDVEDR